MCVLTAISYCRRSTYGGLGITAPLKFDQRMNAQQSPKIARESKEHARAW